MGRDVPFGINKVCDGCGATGAYDFMGDCYCQECCDKHQADAEARRALALKLDAECQAMPAAKLLQDLLRYSRWSGDDFAINQPDDDDHAIGGANRLHMPARIGTNLQEPDLPASGSSDAGSKTERDEQMNKTIGAVTVSGFDPAFINVERDGEFPERLKVTLRGVKDIGGNQPHATATFTKEEFALFLVRCQQQL